jgi:hypothetical protein
VAFFFPTAVFVHLPVAQATHPERMIDFVRWMAAMELALGASDHQPYQSAYSESLRRGLRSSLEELPLAGAVLELVDGASNEWTGTPYELLMALSNLTSRRAVNSHDWPDNPNKLSKRLKPLLPELKKQGIEVTFGRGRKRWITVKRIGGEVDDGEY